MLSFVFLCCKNTQVSPNQSNFGAVITLENAVSFEEVVGQMEGKDSLETKLKARVESVCQAKGCWMNLVSVDGTSDKSLFVKFKDYGFFVPKDIGGRNVIVEGVAYKEMTSVEELRHYAEDEGKTPEEIEQITTPVEEYKFMATGVIVL